MIEPGLIKTNFAETAVGLGARTRTAPTPTSTHAVAAATAGAYDGPIGKLGAGPEAVAKAIEKAITAEAPAHALPGHRLGPAAPDPAHAAARPRLGRQWWAPRSRGPGPERMPRT